MKKNKTSKFTFFKKHRKIAIVLVCLVLVVSSLAFINYSRYVKNIITTYYLRTKNFYFNSNRLTLEGKVYQSKPWVVGDGSYEISITMDSKLNELKVMEDDLEYNVKCEVEKDGKKTNVAVCNIGNGGDIVSRKIIGNRSDGTDKNKDNFTVVVDATGEEIKDGDVIFIKVTAESTKPYKQTLSATFELVAGNYGVSYEIDDQVGRRYIDCLINNTLPDEAKVVELEITDTSKIIFDQNNSILDDIKNYYSKEDIAKYGFGTIVNNDGYITKVRFRVEEKSGRMVRFYKTNLSDDFSLYNNRIDDKGNLTDETTGDESKGIVKLEILEEECFSDSSSACYKKHHPEPETEPEPEPIPVEPTPEEPVNPDSGEDNGDNTNTGEEGL
ncbi:MAG TPA: hypothetical protein DCE23_09720 [Firmicutes bacterium]|nr:hypothetical protein [Bacillota bacterium]